jgi:tetratricopeptide (TPR) repeat protein
MDVEHDNLRAAIKWEPQDTSGKEMVLRLAGSMRWYWYLRGYFTEGTRYLSRVIQRAGGQLAPGPLPRALNGAGSLAFAQGDHAVARELHLQGPELQKQLGDRSGIAGSLGDLGNAAHGDGDYALAQGYYEQSVNRYGELGNRLGMANVLTNLARNMMLLGNLIYAKQLLTESVAIQRELGNRIGMAASLDSRGMAAERQGNYE